MSIFRDTGPYKTCLTLEFLSTLHVKLTSGVGYQEGYGSFYLNRELYELNLSGFNSIFSFLPDLDLDQHHVLREFNPNSFWYIIIGNYQ